MSAASKKVPAFLGHGTADSTVQLKAGKNCAAMLQNSGVSVQFRQYKYMQHSVCAQELEDVVAFIRTCLGVSVNGNVKTKAKTS